MHQTDPYNYNSKKYQQTTIRDVHHLHSAVQPQGGSSGATDNYIKAGQIEEGIGIAYTKMKERKKNQIVALTC